MGLRKLGNLKNLKRWHSYKGVMKEDKENVS
jgi:hypothetical protein